MKAFSFLVLLLLFLIAPGMEAEGQSKFNDRSRKLNKFKYRTHIGKPSRKCTALKRKRKNGPDLAKKYKLGKKPKTKKMAESDLSFNFKYDDKSWISIIDDTNINILLNRSIEWINKDLYLNPSRNKSLIG